MANLLRHQLVKNIAFLFSAQGVSYLVPLVTFPYLTRALGADGFGVYSLAITASGFLQIPMEYGFGLSASREIAKVSDDSVQMERLFWAVTWTKLLIGITTFVILAGVIFFMPSLHQYWQINMVACLSAACSAFFPIWLLQGQGRMKDLATISIGSKIINAIFMFTFIHQREDIFRLVTWTAIVNFAAACAGHYVAFKERRPRFIVSSIEDIVNQLTSGFSVFMSQIGFLFYANTNLIMLSVWCDAKLVGMYAIAEKIMRAAAMMTYAVSQAIYPVSSRKFANSIREGEQFLRKVLAASIFPIFGGCILLCVGAPYIIQIASGKPPEVMGEAIQSLRILSVLPTSIFVCNMYGSQTLLALGKDREYFLGTVVSGCIAIGLQVVLIPRFGANGASICLAVAELSLLVLYGYYARKMNVRLLF